MKIFFQELKFTQVLKCILEPLDEAIQKQQDQNTFPLPPKCFTNVQYSAEGTRTQREELYGLDAADAISTSISLDSICSSN